MDKILVVEDSQFFSSIVRKRINTCPGLSATCASSMAEAVAMIDAGEQFFLSLLDLNLPDAPNGEIVEYFSARGMPSIVFTGSYDAALRDRIYKQDIIDYVVKENPASIDYLISMVERVARNRHLKALVVDDSRTSRRHIARRLGLFQLNVLEAGDGEEALEIIAENQDIRLLITDYNMPKMDGFELIKAVRKTHSKGEMAIIGLSASGRENLSARLIKSGANDFITKPFQFEELLCRVSQNLDMLDLVESLKVSATIDYLTGLYNRRFFFEAAKPLCAEAVRSARPIAVMMLDIDHFKVVNDTHGHDAGDAVLVRVAEAMKERTRDSDLLARFGGEEFCLLLTGADGDALTAIAGDYLSRVSRLSIPAGDDILKITVSAGLCAAKAGSLEDTLEEMIAIADGLLYQAKQAGRNRAFVSLRPDAEPIEVAGCD